MQIHYISECLDIPELHIDHIEKIGDKELHLQATPRQKKQPCLRCQSEQSVIRKGSHGIRIVRHVSMGTKKTFIHIPSIRLFCTACQLHFSWSYEFVSPKQRYSHLFRAQCFEHALGSTVKHSAHMQHVPISTVHRMHQEQLEVAASEVETAVWQAALDTNGLVLAVDDFAVKKGHTYNTGIHNLRGETMPGMLPGRKLTDLQAYTNDHPHFAHLQPKTVVMDLARAYHSWIAACFPTAIRIADHFHVHRYVIESVQEVRKTVQRMLSPRQKDDLKSHHHLLNPPKENLPRASQIIVERLLKYSTLLRHVWTWRESFTVWYNESPNVAVAERGFIRWCSQGDEINHPAVRSTLRTMRNWQMEIVNYHHCRWTNATVEGRHNRIKAFQRRHYFTRNLNLYKMGILMECNRSRLLG